MNISDLIPQLLNHLVANRVWQDATPDDLPRAGANGAILDFIIFSVVGGVQAEYVDQTMPEKVNARVQIHAVSRSGAQADLLIKQVRDTLLASDYTVGVYGSPVGTYDAARKLRGKFQQYSIWYQQ